MIGYLIIFVLIWVMTLGAWFVMNRYAKSSDTARIKTRLLGAKVKRVKSETATALFTAEEQPKGRVIPNLMERFNLGEKLRVLIEQAGAKWDPIKFVHMCLALFIFGYFVAYMMLPDVFRRFAVLIAFAFGALPVIHLYRLRKKRLHAFEEIFPDSLEFISRSMRAGHAFSVSLEMIHREFNEPLSSEFRRTFEEHNLGLPIDVALQGMGKRIPLLDVQFFVSAVLLQRRTGGNLAEILDKLAYVIRERFKLRGRIKAVSAHGRITGICLTCIPMAVGTLMFFVNPDHMTFFVTDETGNIMAGIAVGLQVLGYLIIKKIVQIEV